MKALDPRLRRLVSSLTLTTARGVALRKHDLSRFRITAAVPAAADPAVPEALTKRVLVLLNQDTPPQPFADLNWARIAGRTYSVSVPLTRLQELSERPEVRFVESGRPMAPCLDTSLKECKAYDVQHPAAPALPFNGTDVVIGIIDYGCDYTLDDFRTAAPERRTRLELLWDQSLQPQPGEHSPIDFGYGVEYNRLAIDQALQQTNPFQFVRH
jgi:hypothetical protein